MKETLLRCPACGYEYMHHEVLEVFERPKEDAEHGVHVTITGCTVTVDNKMTGNPSLRRDGLRIRFWCEGCDEKSTLTLVQHKGQSFLQLAIER